MVFYFYLFYFFVFFSNRKLFTRAFKKKKFKAGSGSALRKAAGSGSASRKAAGSGSAKN